MGQNLHSSRLFLTTGLLLVGFQQSSILVSVNALAVSSFHGVSLPNFETGCRRSAPSSSGIASLTMRKQKASDRRTRRMQRGQDLAAETPIVLSTTITSSPMAKATWTQKQVSATASAKKERTAGRGRSRKRSTLYKSLSSYHSHFLALLSAEYQAEEDEILGRIKASADDPLGLEASGHALFDLYPERRGDLYSDEVYRLTKAGDATTFSSLPPSDGAERTGKASSSALRGLPPNHKFSSNDVILLTLQPRGSGDFFYSNSLPTNSMAVSVEARVLNTGPSYVDVALSGGSFEAAFGPAPNNVGPSGKGDPRMRLRADCFFSNVPYTRMVAALSQITSIPDRPKKSDGGAENKTEKHPHGKISMDELLRDTVLSTFALNDPTSTPFHDTDACNLRDIANNLARAPLPNSPKLAKQVMDYIQSNPYGTFSPFNGPQLTALEAALTRRLTLIQGPPGTGKTTVASAIGFGFVHQCRSISPNAKVLACAFSNVGADNLVEQLVRVGLKVVRIGKPSAVCKSLWDYTLDAAIDQDPYAQKAVRNAAWATSQLAKTQSKMKGTRRSQNSVLSERSKRDVATAAVKASIKACNIAATKAFRAADVIVSTSIGASDRMLLAACGIGSEDEALQHDSRQKATRSQGSQTKFEDSTRQEAPDGLPPLSLPFVIVDEACQSVEPATLIPVTSTNSCRSLVLVGDPCQLPPTVKTSSSSSLSISLMERLAATLSQPVIVTAQPDMTERDERFLQSRPTKQARSMIRAAASGDGPQKSSYRKRFSGSLLLSVQYRMHPSISAFSSAMFYDGLLATPSFLASQRQFPESLIDDPREGIGEVGVRFIDVRGHGNERRGQHSKFSKTVFAGSSTPASLSSDETSYWNQQEADLVVNLIKRIIDRREGHEPTIGVVTPYNGQVELITSILSKDEEFQKLAGSLAQPVEVNSVDGYQGRERDVIIFSAVRSNRHGKVGFLSDWRRMNVALTRARSALVVIGDKATLTEGDRHWAAFGKWCEGMDCVLAVDENVATEEVVTR